VAFWPAAAPGAAKPFWADDPAGAAAARDALATGITAVPAAGEEAELAPPPEHPATAAAAMTITQGTAAAPSRRRREEREKRGEDEEREENEEREETARLVRMPLRRCRRTSWLRRQVTIRPHAARRTPHAARRTPHAARRTPHAGRAAPAMPSRAGRSFPPLASGQSLFFLPFLPWPRETRAQKHQKIRSSGQHAR
jgi:hypothetical protein